MAAVGVARRVGVVLEDVDIAGGPLVGQPLLGLLGQPLEDPLARLVVDDDLADRMAETGVVMRRTRSADPTLSSVVVSDMFESPTMTCRRRNFSASACGSSRVLMIGRLRVVADETPSQMWSARWLTQ